jgi:GcrA cell cycle regulator
MSWTDERVELLRKLWLEGHSASQIAAELANGITRNAVIGKVHRLGLSGRAKAPTPSAARPRPAAAPAARPAPRVVGAPAGQPSVSSAAILGGARTASQPMVRGNVAYAMAAQAEEAVAPMAQTEAVVLPMSERVTIMELRESMCRWPLGDPTSPDFRYCGGDAPIGAGPYCAYHASIAYQPAQDRRRDRSKAPIR